MAAQLGYWLTHTVVFAWMDSWSKCQYCCMLLWSSVTIIKFENHYCYHTQNKSKNNNKFSKNDKKVRTDNFFNQWLWVTQWLSDLQRYCKQTGLALQPAAWHHFQVIPDSSHTIWPALCTLWTFWHVKGWGFILINIFRKRIGHSIKSSSKGNLTVPRGASPWVRHHVVCLWVNLPGSYEVLEWFGIPFRPPSVIKSIGKFRVGSAFKMHC